MEINQVVIHYAEIGIKGGNRSKFEDLLVGNIQRKLDSLCVDAKREYGQIILTLKEDATDEAGIEKTRDILKRIPGIAYFSFAARVEQDIEKIKEAALNLTKDKTFDTFKIAAKRSNKDFPLSSMEINREVGAVIDKTAKMDNPDLTIKIEITNKDAFISCDRTEGTGGLPTNPQQKVVTLLSGGFDSPVAAFMMMKRGCQNILVHFQNENQMTGAVASKIKELAEQLAKYQTKTRLFIIPFAPIQKEIIMKVQSEMRMLIYRRFMLRISERIAEQNKAKFLIVGDSMSQVASQTLENLAATYRGSMIHILSPLIGLDKSEIIEISKQIGTYEISAQPYGDCCSFFLPKHPMLKSDADLLDKVEEEFDMDALVEASVKSAEYSEF